MSKKKDEQGKFMSLVKVGPKGQIVIPKEVRDMFSIEPGDSMLLLADVKRGIALDKYSAFEKIAEAIFKSKDSKEYSEFVDQMNEEDE